MFHGAAPAEVSPLSECAVLPSLPGAEQVGRFVAASIPSHHTLDARSGPDGRADPASFTRLAKALAIPVGMNCGLRSPGAPSGAPQPFSAGPARP